MNNIYPNTTTFDLKNSRISINGIISNTKFVIVQLNFIKTILIAFILLAAISIGSVSKVYAQASAVIVTVDGLDFKTFVIMPWDVPPVTTSYLDGAIKSMSLGIPESDIVPFIWNGDSRFTRQYVDQLREHLRNAYQRAKQEKKKL